MTLLLVAKLRWRPPRPRHAGAGRVSRLMTCATARTAMTTAPIVETGYVIHTCSRVCVKAFNACLRIDQSDENYYVMCAHTSF